MGVFDVGLNRAITALRVPDTSATVANDSPSRWCSSRALAHDRSSPT